MDVWGIGLRWLCLSLLFSLPIWLPALFFKDIYIATSVDSFIFYGLGIFLLLIGIPFWFVSARTVGREFKKGRLCTTGVFRLCRNPIYAAWILFLVPGVVMFSRKPLLLLVPLIMYVVLRFVLPREEEWLEQMFGEEYLEYKKATCRILPVSGFKSQSVGNELK